MLFRRIVINDDDDDIIIRLTLTTVTISHEELNRVNVKFSIALYVDLDSFAA